MEKDYVQYDKHLTACFNQNLKNKKGKEKRKKCENQRQQIQKETKGEKNYQYAKMHMKPKFLTSKVQIRPT